MIALQDLRYWYPGAGQPTLRGVTLEIGQGELVLLTGRSGCGKSTFLHCLKGLIPKLYGGRLEGRLVIDGQETAELSVAQLSRLVGLVMQDPDSQLCNLFVADEVAFGVENLLLPLEQCVGQVDRALHEAGLTGLRRRQVYQLSGGQKQRVAIASVLAMDTPVILLDEPTANLDARAGQEVFALIDRLRADGRTILVVQHEVDEVIDRADKLLILDQGGTAEFGPPREVLARHGQALTEEFGIGLPQVTLAALRSGRRELVQKVPLSVDEFVTASGTARLRAAPAAAQARVGREAPATRTGPLVIEAQSLSYTYPGSREPAISDLSLGIAPGEVVAVIGKNGSGKSTLARLLVGLLKPTSGQVLLNGQDLRRLKPHEVHQSTGYVFQYPEHQFLADTVGREIAYGLEVQQRSAPEVEATTQEAMCLLGLEALAARHPFSLSGGEKRRLSVATMIVLKPRLLILDEPTYGLDEGNLANLVAFIFARLREAGITVVFITHDMRLVAEQAQRAVVLSQSRLIFDGSPAALFADATLMETAELALPPAVRLAGRLRERGWPIALEAVTLDDLTPYLTPEPQHQV